MSLLLNLPAEIREIILAFAVASPEVIALPLSCEAHTLCLRSDEPQEHKISWFTEISGLLRLVTNLQVLNPQLGHRAAELFWSTNVFRINLFEMASFIFALSQHRLTGDLHPVNLIKRLKLRIAWRDALNPTESVRNSGPRSWYVTETPRPEDNERRLRDVSQLLDFPSLQHLDILLQCEFLTCGCDGPGSDFWDEVYQDLTYTIRELRKRNISVDIQRMTQSWDYDADCPRYQERILYHSLNSWFEDPRPCDVQGSARWRKMLDAFEYNEEGEQFRYKWFKPGWEEDEAAHMRLQIWQWAKDVPCLARKEISPPKGSLEYEEMLGPSEILRLPNS